MPPIVCWTRRAESQFERASARLPTTAGVREDTDRRLAKAFATARDVLVLNYFVGFKSRAGEHIVKVDVHELATARTYVVKLADPERLEREVRAWNQCHIDDSNPVFLKLTAVDDPESPGRACAIAYQDADVHIGAESTMWLETAVRRCVRYDSPGLGSIVGALSDLIDQLGRLYRLARLETQGDGPIETMPRGKGEGGRHVLSRSLGLWREGKPLATRRQIDAAFAVGDTRFIDPVDYYGFLDGAISARPPLPAVHRGLSHGDLHGRNSLVGIDADEQASFPTLFDYDSIHRDNLVGWDFVELETELKIRVYADLYGHLPPLERSRAIHALEWRLAEATGRLAGGRWESNCELSETSEDRLFRIAMAIRREAKAVLGRLRAGAVEWLHEFLFLLGAYGLTSVRYENQTDIERQAAYLSAGVAAAFWERLQPKSPALEAAAGPLAQQPHATYQRPLAMARQWNRGVSHRAAATELLSGLVERYPAALHVHYEWAFNAMSLGEKPTALDRLTHIETNFGHAMDEDTLCLWGRIYKEAGDRHLLQAVADGDRPEIQRISFEEADEQFALAVERYEQAFAVKRGSFPAINVATLKLVRAGLNHRLGHPDAAAESRRQSRQMAGDIIAMDLPLVLPDDAIWTRATKAEATLLTGDWATAARRYESALELAKRESSYTESMGRQILRIAAVYRLLDEKIPTDAFASVPEFMPYLAEEPTK